ncbi:MAG: hypothetical protein Q7U96_04010, partial [Chloroflexota bacterium]|nr:hypothetical protein [Chloroflexota bacterium]
SLALLYLIRLASSTVPWILVTMPIAATAVFAGGWLLAGMGLRPRGSMLRGASLAALLYVFVGAMWVVTFNVGILGNSATDLAQQPVGLVMLVLMWPLQIAQVLGFFGLALD